MHYLLTARQTRALEAAAVEGGVTLRCLMDRAGSAVAEEVLAAVGAGRVVVLAGGGNNGGDGWVAARLLHESGRDTIVYSIVEPASLPEPARAAAAAANAAGVRWALADPAAVTPAIREAQVVVDALLGVGAQGAPREPYATLIASITSARGLVVAVDVPSGIDADTGAIPGPVVRADVTVTFIAPKLGCLLQPGAANVGELVVADIGVDAVGSALAGAPEVWSADDYASRIRLPRWDDTKATRGRVLIVGGAPGMTGAVCLAAAGAQRMGAGHVTIAVPEPSLRAVEVMLTTPVKIALPATSDGALSPDALEAVLEAATRADAVVLGPGLGRAPSTRAVALGLVERLGLPLVMDADALHALGDGLALIADRTAPTVITPHAGEAARLLALPDPPAPDDRLSVARALAVGSVTAVLKGPATLVAQEERLAVNPTGGPGLASLGTGDVLAGMIGALLAAHLSPFDAAVVGTYVHGAAGDAASSQLTSLCCTADDVIACVPQAIRALLDRRTCSAPRKD